MVENFRRLRGDIDKKVIMGGSAGANLCLAVALSLLDEQKRLQPNLIVAACPSTIYPSAIPEEYKGLWHPEKLVDSAMLDRKSMMTCMSKLNNTQVDAAKYYSQMLMVPPPQSHCGPYYYIVDYQNYPTSSL
jgi:acetyl esterase/lipase